MGWKGQGYGKENYVGPIVSRSEIYRCNGGRLTFDKMADYIFNMAIKTCECDIDLYMD